MGQEHYKTSSQGAGRVRNVSPLQWAQGHPQQSSLVQPDPPGSPTARGHLGAAGPGTRQESQSPWCVPQPTHPTSCPRPPSLGHSSPQPLPQRSPWPSRVPPYLDGCAQQQGRDPARRGEGGGQTRGRCQELPWGLLTRDACEQPRSPRAAGFRTHAASCPTAPPAPGPTYVLPHGPPYGDHGSFQWGPTAHPTGHGIAHPSGTPWLIPLGYHS